MRVQTESKLDSEIGWFLDHLSGERAASPHTVAAYDRDLKQIANWLTDYKVDTFTQVDGDASAKVRSLLAP